MPCEVIPCFVNNTYIVDQARANKLGKSTMHETKAKPIHENSLVWTKAGQLQGGSQLHKDVSSYGRASSEGQPDHMLQNDLKFHDIGYRILPRAFSTLGDFGAIEESESTSSGHLGETRGAWFSRSKIQDCETPRRYSTSSWPSEKIFRERFQQTSREFPTYKNNSRRQSEGFIISGTKAFGVVGYRNESVNILGKQRSGNHNLNTKLAKRVNESQGIKTLYNISLASFDMMSSVVTTLDQPKGYYSLPRRLSLPVKDMGNDFYQKNGKPQRNSLPTEECLREYNFDNDTELQWQRLVARAKTLQFTSTRSPEIVRSRSSDKNKEELTQKATEPVGDLDKGVDSTGKDAGQTNEDICSEKENNIKPINTRRIRRTEERRYSLKKIPTVVESSSESQSKKDSDDNTTEKEMTQPQGHDTVVRERQPTISLNDNTNRRHSVAVVRHTEESKERISGYSTHGALEYAKTLMGKIQEEGKTKTKKERLDEMSKVLKLVLEELNRIELPDRDLVSLFISLRAKMVNLRAELKADEVDKDIETKNEIGEVKKDENEKKYMSRSLPRQSSDGESTPTHSRRFSWI